MTKYGKKILEIVSSSRSHMTAEEIFDALRQTYPTVVLATVYLSLIHIFFRSMAFFSSHRAAV